MPEIISTLTELAEGPAVGDLFVLTDISDTTQAASGTTKKNKGQYALGSQVNAQTGTTYTYLTTDFRKLVTHSNAAAIAGTLPQAGASFPAGWWMLVQNRGAGALTITPTTSTIDGAATLVLNQNEGAIVVSDGTNYFTLRGKATGAAGVGDVVGPGSATDLALTRFDGTTGKLIQDSTVTLDDVGAMTFPEMVAPATPAAGKVALYAKSDGLFYSKDDAGLETVVTGGGGGGGSPGGADGDIQYRVDASTFGGSPLKRIDANTVEQKNTTTAQTFRIYKTTTSNFRLRISNVSDKWEIASESDTTPNDLDILLAGAFRYRFTTSQFTTSSAVSLGASSSRWSTFFGSDANITGEYRWNNLTRIQAGVDGFPIIRSDAAAANAAGWIFGTNDVNGVRLKRNGTKLEVKLGGDSAYTNFKALTVGTDPVAFASLPTGVEGMHATVTDSNTATWGATIAGGGANRVLAYFNGTNWTVAGI